MARGHGRELSGVAWALGASGLLALAEVARRATGSADTVVPRQQVSGHAVWLDIVHGGDRLAHFLPRLGTYDSPEMAASVAALIAERAVRVAGGGGQGPHEVRITVHDFGSDTDRERTLGGFGTQAEAIEFAREVHGEVS